jgi:hypothetical protein
VIRVAVGVVCGVAAMIVVVAFWAYDLWRRS